MAVKTLVRALQFCQQGGLQRVDGSRRWLWPRLGPGARVPPAGQHSLWGKQLGQPCSKDLVWEQTLIQKIALGWGEKR